MYTLFIVLSSLVALEHFYFLILEMFFWTKPKGLKTFGLSREQAESSKVLAANQGLYNGFLAAGLIWGMMTHQKDVVMFFLICVTLAGTYGWITTKKSALFFVQALPALIAMAIGLLS